MGPIRPLAFEKHVPRAAAAGRVEQTGPTINRAAVAVMTELARDIPSWGDIPRLIDSTPVPCGKSRETVKRSDLAGRASYGYCASHSRYFWGFRLYLICAPDGMPVGLGLANPKSGEREAAETMLRHDRHLIRPGQVIVGDKGFAGRKLRTLSPPSLKPS